MKLRKPLKHTEYNISTLNKALIKQKKYIQSIEDIQVMFTEIKWNVRNRKNNTYTYDFIIYYSIPIKETKPNR